MPPRTVLRALFHALLIATLGAGGTARAESEAAGGNPGEWTESSMKVGAVERWYRIYRPRSLQPGAPTVLLLHGGTQSMRKLFAARAGGTRAWPDLADREGFLLVVPNGTNAETGDTRGDKQNWNDLRPADERQSDADDVRFIRQLLDHAASLHRTDPRRVYVTGASNGGMMTYRLLIEAPERFAAGASFIATLPADLRGAQAPTLATPILIANGTQDPLVKWDGGAVRGQRTVMLGAPANRDWWVRANRAETAGAKEEALPDGDPSDGCRLHRTLYPATRPGAAPVVFIRMEGAGHALPSRAHELADSILIRRLIGPLCRDAEGAELAWEFMSKHRR